MEKWKQHSHRYNEDIFLNDEGRKKFASNFYRKKVIKDRMVDLSQFDDFKLSMCLQGWVDYL